MCKKANKLGLRPLLTENSDTGVAAGEIVRECMALPYLPPGRIETGFNAIKQAAQLKPCKDQMKPFLDYVETTWIKSMHRMSHTNY